MRTVKHRPLVLSVYDYGAFVNDAATRKFIQELLGKNRRKKSSFFSITRVLWSRFGCNVVEDWEIANIGWRCHHQHAG
jgi:hypothetical protein